MEEFLTEVVTKPHFVCITEHWYMQKEVDCIRVQEYISTSVFARKNRTHGGSAIFVCESVEAEELINIRKLSIEGQIEVSAVVNRPLKTVVICIYRPPSSEEILFLSVLADILNSLLNNFIQFTHILAGNFNIDLLKRSRK